MTGFPPVPGRYRGVWSRTLLQTPTGSDTTTWVRWLQTAGHHGDLRVPAVATTGRALTVADHLGFSGTTEVTADGDREVCTWHRQIDLQPPGRHPDAGRMVFENDHRVIETGVHGDYLEVWERLPGSDGPCIVLEETSPADAAEGAAAPARLLVAGPWLMRLRPRSMAWPADTRPGDPLADVVTRHPAAAKALLDFEITFGRWDGSLLEIEASTAAGLAGTAERCEIRRTGDHSAEVDGSAGPTTWRVLEWV